MIDTGRIFASLTGKPCQQVANGWGSFLTIEFGDLTSINLPANKYRPARSFLRGEWHLWIYCCGRHLKKNNDLYAHNESTRSAIADACSHLESKSLEIVKVDASSGGSAFEFEDAISLTTWPYSDELETQWMLFCPNGYVLTYRSDGLASWCSAKTSDRDTKWSSVL